jgi:hypothetical protein
VVAGSTALHTSAYYSREKIEGVAAEVTTRFSYHMVAERVVFSNL